MTSGTAADAVSCAVIRKAVEDSGLSQQEIARRLDWMKTVPDTKRVRRAMGLDSSRAGSRKQEHVTYRRALELIEAMDLDPVDYGL